MGDKNDSLGNRLKALENAFRHHLPPRTLWCIRLDGCHFSQYTKGLVKPWDERLEEVMNITAIELCKQIQNAQIAYVQSDEITLLVHNYKNYQTQAWFDNNIQKITSVSAAIASSTFTMNSVRIWNGEIKPAYFDSRVFMVPDFEAVNVFHWRQKDMSRNSVSGLAQANFSHKELQGLSTNQLKQKLLEEKNICWEQLPGNLKNGRCIVKEKYLTETNGQTVERSRWVVDNNIPIFKDNKEYIEQYLKCDNLKE